ncbi:tyrosine-type recombinase/integrase [uncultured Treponema sp.]|uniref:tyrosine-type recombinase/integrase n=1 Tax=uncultured Treponema sp. TaxID=162155 RepID=UPI0025E0D4C3|nr:tyrosine-type recombinase/integrase [uncultured Treponema sp.]
MTVSDAIEEYLSYIESVRTLSANTVTACRSDLLQFKEMSFIGPEKEMAAIELEDLKQCVGVLSKKKRSAASINRFISSVRSLFGYCRKFGHLNVNVAFELKTVKNPRKLPRFMTGAEIDKLCHEPEVNELLWEKRDKAIFEMLYSSGCRASEIVSLTFDDFSGDYSSAIVTGKGSKDRRVYFEEDAQNALKAYLEDRKKRFGESDKERHIFVNQRGGALSTGGLRLIITRYSGSEGTKRHVSPHAFRHTFATAMITNGADVRLVQELLGHSSISTTQRYTHISTEKMIEMYNKAHPHGGKS